MADEDTRGPQAMNPGAEEGELEKLVAVDADEHEDPVDRRDGPTEGLVTMEAMLEAQLMHPAPHNPLMSEEEEQTMLDDLPKGKPTVDSEVDSELPQGAQEAHGEEGEEQEVSGDEGSNSNDDDDDDDSDDEILPRLPSNGLAPRAADEDEIEEIPLQEVTKFEVLLEPATESEVNVVAELPAEAELVVVGSIASIIDNLVVIPSVFGAEPLDSNTILWLEDRSIVGKVADTFGPVSQPHYAVKFSSPDAIDREKLSIGTKVYFAPGIELYTHYILTTRLRNLPGSDASWLDDQEPPSEEVEFSDDEQEQMAKKAKKKNKKGAKLQDGAEPSPEKQTTKTQPQPRRPPQHQGPHQHRMKTPYPSQQHGFRGPRVGSSTFPVPPSGPPPSGFRPPFMPAPPSFGFPSTHPTTGNPFLHGGYPYPPPSPSIPLGRPPMPPPSWPAPPPQQYAPYSQNQLQPSPHHMASGGQIQHSLNASNLNSPAHNNHSNSYQQTPLAAPSIPLFHPTSFPLPPSNGTMNRSFSNPQIGNGNMNFPPGFSMPQVNLQQIRPSADSQHQQMHN